MAPSAIKGATLVDQKTGSHGNDYRRLTTRENSQPSGLAGNDRLIDRWGNDALLGGRSDDRLEVDLGTDWLPGDEGSDRLAGGKGTDFFAWEARDAHGSWIDTITNFQESKGERLGITAILDTDNSFEKPGWNYIGQKRFTGTDAELLFWNGWLQGDLNGDAKIDLNIQLVEVKTIDMDWIS